MMKMEIFHTVFEQTPRHVATLEFALPLTEALEQAFAATQNLEFGWTENPGETGVSVQPTAEVIAAQGCRSTSMGDYARVVENGKESFWRCCTTGWRQISAADTKLAGEAALFAAMRLDHASLGVKESNGGQS